MVSGHNGPSRVPRQRALDHFVLNGCVQGGEVGAVTADANDEVGVALGILLDIQQHGGVEIVDLQVAPVRVDEP